MKRVALAALAAWLIPLSALAQMDKRSLDYQLKNAPKPGEAKMVNASLPELVNLRLSQLEEDLDLTAQQLPAWKTYKDRVQSMLDDARRGARVSASETNAPKRLDAIADLARNRLTAVEDIVDAGKALYAVLSPKQKDIADRRLALPLQTLTGSDAGGDARAGAPNAPSK